MGIINRLPIILERATKLAERKKSSPAVPFVRREIIRGTAKADAEEAVRNMLALGDNIDFIAWLLAERRMAGTVQLVYLDPPFFSKADYGAEIKLSVKDGIKVPAMKQPAYKDTWENGMEEYLTGEKARSEEGVRKVSESKQPKNAILVYPPVIHAAPSYDPRTPGPLEPLLGLLGVVSLLLGIAMGYRGCVLASALPRYYIYDPDEYHGSGDSSYDSSDYGSSDYGSSSSSDSGGGGSFGGGGASGSW